MKNIRLILEYDGTNYAGWQTQINAITVQDTVEAAIKNVTGEKIKLIGSSRTDSGVHARGYVCNFITESNIPPLNFMQVINSKLPEDIVTLKSEEVPLEFHSQYHSKGKKYSYAVLNRLEPAAIYRNYMYHYKGTLNFENMLEASKYFIGTHDFCSFKSNGSSVKSTIRTIYDIEIIKQKDIIKFYVSGDGFLYNMVRIIVGTLLKVGAGKKKVEDVSRIIELKDRKNAGPVVPSRGLCLEEVFYSWIYFIK